MPCRYPQGGQLIEVNSHSIFSKYFSESGKLVSKLFTNIRELVDEDDTLIFILIDEVESLAAARRVSPRQVTICHDGWSYNLAAEVGDIAVANSFKQRVKALKWIQK